MAIAMAIKSKLVLKMSVSVDGFVAGPNGEVDWVLRTQGDDSTALVVETLRNAGVHIMGSRCYYDMAAFWPFSDIPYQLSIHPVVLGQGQALFSGLRSLVDLQLISARPFGSGVVIAVYQPA
jgi:dihydrofolate reductase